MDDTVRLREVVASDLPTFFDHQRDPDAAAMAAFPPRDRAAFFAHWTRILQDASGIEKTILAGGDVAGYVVCFEDAGVHLVGYWLGREYWGRGIATRALAQFIADTRLRPLVAHVASHNIASVRVLQKCGFAITGRTRAAAPTGGPDVEELILTLA
jgi:RimJ/RimL family protein N-acetyltransferase